MHSLAVSNTLTHIRRVRYVWTGNTSRECRQLFLALRPVGVYDLGLKARTVFSSQLFWSHPKVLPRVCRGQHLKLEPYGPAETRASFAWEFRGW